MKHSTFINSVIFITFSIIALPLSGAKKALAIGCDTYYRVTGQIAGCSDTSTEKAEEQWRERYSICLEIQLSQEISIYRNKMATYYAQQNRNFEQNVALNNLSSPEDKNTSSLSVSLRQSASYSGDADFCNDE